MWSSGKMVCTGSNSAENANIAAKRFVRRLRRIGFPVRIVLLILQTYNQTSDFIIRQFSAQNQ